MPLTDRDYLSARAQCAAWVRSILNDESEVSISNLRNRAMVELGTDSTFVESLKEEFFAQTLHVCVQEVVSRTRRRAQIPPNPLRVPRETISQKRKRLVWEKWMEYTGTHHVRVMDMGRQDLLSAVRIRAARGERELAVSRFWAALAERLPDDVLVRDVFTEDQITAIWYDVVGSEPEDITNPIPTTISEHSA